MKKYELDIDDFSDEEIQQFIEETIQEYDEWNVNLDTMINKLSIDSKLFLNTLYEKTGEKVFYIIFGYLNSDSLIDYNELTDNGFSEFLHELSNEDMLKFVELLIEFSKQEIELSEVEIDFEKIIKKLKKEVSILKKEIAQPSKYINTNQFEERYSLTTLQQKSLRTRVHDPLPFTIVNNRVLYEPDIIDKWMENFRI